jgi:hypothetical protein
MSERVKDKYPVIALRRLLKDEKDSLEFWNRLLLNSDADEIRMAKGNIPSTESRIRELIEAIEQLSPTISK